MDIKNRMTLLSKLAEEMQNKNDELDSVIEKAYQHNKWFTPENMRLAVKNIREQFLDEQKLKQWISNYRFMEKNPKRVGIVMAGNIPLVGFHDFLCVFISGNSVMVKLSSKDDVLFPFFLNKMIGLDSEIADLVSASEILKGMDAVIATGSNNSSRHFEYYFGKYPHIIRKNRNAVAVLQGNESKEEIGELGFDIFSYFGLGCRNVSKLMVPMDYDFNFFFQSLEKFSKLNEHNKYKNNYDYNRAIHLLNKTPHLANDFLILKEDVQVASPVAQLNYEFYADENDLNEKLKRDEEIIQCIVGKGFIPFGKSQSPELWDYADNVDTMKFLSELN
ncbi:MAG: acyl-CoA reductase [Chitinophagales bacterium]